MSMRQKRLPIVALERIDDLCAEFERKWQSNEPQTIESVIADEASSIERTALLAELIVLDIDYRQRRGEKPTQQEYIDRFPEDADAISNALKEDDKRSGAFEPPTIARLAKLFPDLQIIEFINAGGMGAVYKARQEGLDRIVALKILPEEFGHDVKFALRFTREARTLAKLNHPNIVAVYEFGSVEDTYYFLMEFIDGSTLRDVVMAGQLAPKDALAIVPLLCDALQYAHDKGVIHRDIKPENILMDVDGSVKIADFGLSRILGSENQQEALTGTHQVMGTPRYMAPEQFDGAHSVDHRADIYSLGVVFYEMLTGELPVGRFAPPSQKVSIDVRLDDVVLRTLEKEPQLRYQSASQIKSDVQSITSNDDPALARTVLENSRSANNSSTAIGNETAVASLNQQELAGRLLLTRRQLMNRVEDSLRPLFRLQILQILFGVLFIALGAQCWAPNLNITHRVVSGVSIHVYGVFLIISAIITCTGIKRIDYSQPVGKIRAKLDAIRSGYVRRSPAIGLVWWLLWIPLFVALRLEFVLHPSCLWPSLVIGVVGLVVSILLYVKALKSDSAKRWTQEFAGKSIASANRELDEIESAQIQ